LQDVLYSVALKDGDSTQIVMGSLAPIAVVEFLKQTPRR
jgi:hypothetical protein